MEKSQAMAIVQLFQGAYPNTEFVDSVISASVWYMALKEYDFEETKIASLEIIKTEEKGYKVNVAAVIKQINENRIKKKKLENEIRERQKWEEAEKNKISPERMKMYMDMIRREWGKSHENESKNS